MPQAQNPFFYSNREIKMPRNTILPKKKPQN